MSGVQRTKPPLRAAAAKAKGKWDRLSEAPLPDIRSIYLGGGQILVRLPDGSPLTALADDRSLTPELAVNGIYDLAFWNALGSLLRPGDRSVDVGANVGLFSVRMAKLVGPLGRVDCFEPDPEVAEVLQANLDQNWLASRATVHAGALAGESGSLTFRRHPSMRMLSGKPDVANNDHAERAGETFSVPKWRLDQLASAVLPTRLVKIDVEGAETEVLDGMTGLLEAGLVDFVDFEVIRADGPSWHRTASWLRRLSKEFGGRPHTLTETGDLAPVSLDHVIAMAGHFSHILFDLR